MKLTHKIIAIVIVSLLTLGAVLHVTLSHLLYEKFEALEKIEISKNLDRISNDIDNEREHLLTKTKDWAAWDDTYEFIKSHSKSYIASNLTTESILQLQIDGIVYFDTKGALFHSMYVDRENERDIPLPESIKAFFINNQSILIHNDVTSTRSGISLIGNVPYLFTSLPIINSEYKGPIRGTITFIKRINQELIDSISKRTKLQLTIRKIEESVGKRPTEDLFSNKSQFNITGTRYLNDYFNSPILQAQIVMSRDMMKEGRNLLRSLMIILMLAGSILGVTFIYLIQRSITVRMLSIKNELSEIAIGKNSSGLVTMRGKDELAELAKGINSTLEALNLARIEAEEASKAKSTFVANMSHELRTPLNGVYSATELLAETDLDDEQKSLLNIVASSAKNLLTIVNDVLDLSKLQAGKLLLVPSPCDLRAFMETLVKAHEIAIYSKEIEVLALIDSEIPDAVMVDSLRLGQVLNNVIGNASKFTPPQGAIIIDVSLDGMEGSVATISFSVSDTGIGIDREKQKLIFDPFSQADGSITKKFGGTGLGLTISSRLVEIMGGSLDLLSVPNVGTKFFFTIPVEIAVPVESPDPDKSTDADFTPDRISKSAKILLVEDNKINQLLMERILKKRNFEVELANNGEEAIQLLEANNFDLILMDCQMPILDGFSTTTIIREREYGTTSHIPIIALTAYAMSEERQKCIDCGMDYFVSKPVEQKKLFDAIQSALSPRENYAI